MQEELLDIGPGCETSGTKPSRGERKVVKNYIGMLIIASLNNLPYWAAVANAQAICLHFGKEGWLGSVPWCSVILAPFATTGNTILSSKNVGYNIRAIFDGIFMSGGVIGAAFAPNIYCSLVFVAIIGLSCDFGESVMLGYFASKSNGDSMMRAWGIGTGISGILGACYSFACQYFSVPYWVSFIILSPTGLIYPIVFVLMLDAKVEKKKERRGAVVLESAEERAVAAELGGVANVDESDDDQGSSPIEDEQVSVCSAAIWKKTFYYLWNCGLPLFFQYVSISGLVDCSMTKEERETTPYIYGLLTLVYQVTNFVGRAVLKWWKVDRVWTLTLTQFSLWVVGMFDVIFPFTPMWGKVVLNGVIGMIGGLSYVNVFHQVTNHQDATIREREIMTNITSISIGSGIMLASAFVVLMQNTFFKAQCTER